MIGRVIEGTIVLVAVFLVLSRANAFATAVSAIGSVYSGSVKVLQGR